MSERGSPHFMKGLKERRMRLLALLKETSKDQWGKAMAKFAIDENLRRETVNEYFLLLKESGMLDAEDK